MTKLELDILIMIAEIKAQELMAQIEVEYGEIKEEIQNVA